MVRALLVLTAGLVSLTAAPLHGQSRAYYPAQPGDTWTYESFMRGRFTNQVVDSVVHEGTVLYRIRSTDASGREHFFAARYDGTRLYLGPVHGDQTLLADFGLTPGAIAPVQPGTRTARTVVRARHESLDVFGTTFEDVVEVHVAPPTGGGVSYFFARSIGLVGMRSDDSTEHVRLISAKVGGQTFEGSASPRH